MYKLKPLSLCGMRPLGTEVVTGGLSLGVQVFVVFDHHRPQP